MFREASNEDIERFKHRKLKEFAKQYSSMTNKDRFHVWKRLTTDQRDRLSNTYGLTPAKEPRERKSSPTMDSTHMIKSLWKGNIPLWKAFWIFGVLGPALVLFFNSLISAFIPLIGFILEFFLPIALLYYFVVVCVGIWRSSKHYAGLKLFSVLSRISVVAFVLYSVSSFAYRIYYLVTNWTLAHKQGMENEPILLHSILVAGMFLLTVIAVLPVGSKKRSLSWMHYAPFASILLYLVYESTMPASINIRIDVFIIYPMLVICILSPFIKGVRLANRNKDVEE